MTVPPDSPPAGPAKKPDNVHHLATIAIIVLILFIALLVIFSGPLFSGSGGSNAGSAPAATEMPTAEIATRSVTCQATGVLHITGTVESNVQNPLSVEVYGAGYDSSGTELGTGYDTVYIAPYGTGMYTINVLDGCQLGDVGTYEVRIADITWKQHTG